MSSGPSKLCDRCGDVCMTDEECIMRQLRRENGALQDYCGLLAINLAKKDSEIASLRDEIERLEFQIMEMQESEESNG